MDVSIIIVSWNVRGLLKGCLASVYAHTKDVSFEVFVVDNASKDASAAMVASEFPSVRLIANSENRGFAAANNQALAACSGRVILLLNPDTELTDNAAKRMLDFMESHPDTDALGAKLVYPDGALQHSTRSFPSLTIDLMESLYLDQAFPDSMLFNRYRLGFWPHDTLREVDQPYGACLMFRKAAIDTVGFMDERFFMYYDEVELCFRIKRAGGKILFTDAVSVIHHAGQSAKQASVECEHHMHYSRLLFFEKHWGGWSIYVLTANLVLRTFIAWTVFPFLHTICGRPRDTEYFKGPVRVRWEETKRYFSRKKKKAARVS